MWSENSDDRPHHRSFLREKLMTLTAYADGQSEHWSTPCGESRHHGHWEQCLAACRKVQTSSPKISPLHGVSGPIQHTVPWAHLSQHLEWHQFSHGCDGQTDRPCYSICSNKPHLLRWLVRWSLTSLFSTNMAISETNICYVA